jgi:hypothetical protein
MSIRDLKSLGLERGGEPRYLVIFLETARR